MLIITELRRPRQENCELKVSLVYKMRLYLKKIHNMAGNVAQLVERSPSMQEPLGQSPAWNLPL